MNNKGQTLALFVIFLPVLLLLLVLVIDIGKAIVKKVELNNISEIVLEYGLDNLEEENLEDDLLNLVKLNNSDINQIDIDIVDNKIYIRLLDNSDSVFKRIISTNKFDIESNYVGYIVDDKKRIERVGG